MGSAVRGGDRAVRFTAIAKSDRPGLVRHRCRGAEGSTRAYHAAIAVMLQPAIEVITSARSGSALNILRTCLGSCRRHAARHQSSVLFAPGAASSGRLVGRTNWNRAPFLPSENAVSSPPWRSMMVRQMARPSPIPCDLVVTNASKTPLSFLGSIPGPVSFTATKIASDRARRAYNAVVSASSATRTAADVTSENMRPAYQPTANRALLSSAPTAISMISAKNCNHQPLVEQGTLALPQQCKRKRTDQADQHGDANRKRSEISLVLKSRQRLCSRRYQPCEAAHQAGYDRHAPADCGSYRILREIFRSPLILQPRIRQQRCRETQMPQEIKPHGRLEAGAKKPGGRKCPGKGQGMGNDDERRKQISVRQDEKRARTDDGELGEQQGRRREVGDEKNGFQSWNEGIEPRQRCGRKRSGHDKCREQKCGDGEGQPALPRTWRPCCQQEFGAVRCFTCGQRC